MLDLDAIEQRANAATEGPWYWTDGKSKRCDSHNRRALFSAEGLVLSAESVCYGYVDQEEFVEVEPQDQEFIAHARTDIPALIARVRELEAAMAKCAAHTAYLPGAPRELLEGLLASIRRIVDAAKGLADSRTKESQ